MIRHLVLFKLREFSSDEERNLALENVLMNFRSLVGEIAQIREYRVMPDQGLAPGSFDVAIDSTFDNLEDLKAYQAHPAHQFAVDQNRQWVSEKAVIDFQLE